MRSMVVGTVIIGLAMVINVVPLYLAGGPRALGPFGLPVGSLFVVATVALVALGELFAQARVFEYIGALAPKGQEGLFLGYANMPMRSESLAGAARSGRYLFHKLICRGARRDEAGLLVLDRGNATAGWLVLMAIGMISGGRPVALRPVGHRGAGRGACR